MNALMPLIEYLNYDYRDLAIVLLVIEQREGREKVDQLLAEIPGSKTQTNARHFVNRLREALEPGKLPPEKKHGKLASKEAV